MENELTVESVQKLIDRLKKDLAIVQKSRKVSATLKNELTPRITEVVTHLESSLRAGGSPDAGVYGTASHFKELTPLLAQALSLADTDTGACKFKGGCLVTTSAHCDELRGSFDSGHDCEGNPL